jgi:hypothetical protein
VVQLIIPSNTILADNSRILSLLGDPGKPMKGLQNERAHLSWAVAIGSGVIASGVNKKGRTSAGPADSCGVRRPQVISSL